MVVVNTVDYSIFVENDVRKKLWKSVYSGTRVGITAHNPS